MALDFKQEDVPVAELTENTAFIPCVTQPSGSTDDYICEKTSPCKKYPTEDTITLEFIKGEYHIFKTSFKKTGKYSIEFTVKKANDKSVDKGCISAQLSPYNGESMKLVNSSDKNELMFNDTDITSEAKITVEIDVKKESVADHFLTFYSFDNCENGEGRKICGKVRFVYPLCVCYDWEDTPPVIPTKDFVGWDPQNRRKPKIVNGVQTKDNNGIPETVPWQCFDYAKEQLRLAGYSVPGWDESFITGNNKKIFQLSIDITQIDIKNLDTINEFMEGVQYIKESLKSGIPILVGIDRTRSVYPKGQGDKTTDHFVVIVGMGTDIYGKYFTFFDNGTKASGADINLNKIYVKCNDDKLETSDEKYTDGSYNGYLRYPAYQQLLLSGGRSLSNTYIITQIRKSVKIKK